MTELTWSEQIPRILNTGLEIVYEQWELILETAPLEELDNIWNAILSLESNFDIETGDFEGWLEEREWYV